jgi:hypothetical protein
MKLNSSETNSPEFLLALKTPMLLMHHPTKSELGNAELVSLGIGFSKVKTLYRKTIACGACFN